MRGLEGSQHRGRSGQGLRSRRMIAPRLRSGAKGTVGYPLVPLPRYSLASSQPLPPPPLFMILSLRLPKRFLVCSPSIYSLYFCRSVRLPDYIHLVALRDAWALALSSCKKVCCHRFLKVKNDIFARGCHNTVVLINLLCFAKLMYLSCY